ncbi:hypothetical protein [Streptomyces sp. NPDC088746]|uniref:hypothetical protein n=1 Tax=Streptomyces sp. NPDC088746 TaxID=3365885 RepID=UPI00382AF952
MKVWRWLGLRARRAEERKLRARLELSDPGWEVLAQAGGNVAVLHRHLTAAGGEVPSLAWLYRVVHRDLRNGRVLPDRAVVWRDREERETRQALADLALASPPQGAVAQETALRLPRSEAMAVPVVLVGESGAVAGVALPAGARLVRTSLVRAVAEAVGQAMAAEGAVCVFGGPGQGRGRSDGAWRGAAGWKVTWVPVAVRPSVVGMRRVVFDALALPGRFPHISALADAVVAGALGEARVFVIDEAQTLPVLLCLSTSRACGTTRARG